MARQLLLLPKRKTLMIKSPACLVLPKKDGEGFQLWFWGGSGNFGVLLSIKGSFTASQGIASSAAGLKKDNLRGQQLRSWGSSQSDTSCWCILPTLWAWHGTSLSDRMKQGGAVTGSWGWAFSFLFCFSGYFVLSVLKMLIPEAWNCCSKYVLLLFKKMAFLIKKTKAFLGGGLIWATLSE